MKNGQKHPEKITKQFKIIYSTILYDKKGLRQRAAKAAMANYS